VSIGGDVHLTRADRQRYKIPIYNLTTGQAPPDVTGEGAVVEAHPMVARFQPREFYLSPQPFRPAQGGQRHRLHRDFDVHPFSLADQAAQVPKQITPPTSRGGCIGGLP
jgi:hypothetical protein